VLHSDRLDFFYDGTRYTVSWPFRLERAVMADTAARRELREFLREQLPDGPAGSLMIEIPPDWGSFAIKTPHPPRLLRNPLLLCRELELNAPDRPVLYHLTWQPEPEGATILVVRTLVLDFLRELFEPLGFHLAALSWHDPQDRDLQDQPRLFDPAQAHSWSELLAQPRRQRTRRRLIAWSVGLALPLAALTWLWFHGYRLSLPGGEPAAELVQLPDTSVVVQAGTAMPVAESLTVPSGSGEDAPATATLPLDTVSTVVTPAAPGSTPPAVSYSLGRRLVELLPLDSLLYAAIIPGWLTWRRLDGDYDSTRFECPGGETAFQNLAQETLTAGELTEFLVSSRVEAARKIVLFRSGTGYNLLWYY